MHAGAWFILIHACGFFYFQLRNAWLIEVLGTYLGTSHLAQSVHESIQLWPIRDSHDPLRSNPCCEPMTLHLKIAAGIYRQRLHLTAKKETRQVTRVYAQVFTSFHLIWHLLMSWAKNKPCIVNESPLLPFLQSKINSPAARRVFLNFCRTRNKFLCRRGIAKPAWAQLITARQDALFAKGTGGTGVSG